MLSSGMIHADDIGLHHAAQIFIYDAKHLNDLEYIKIVLRQSQIFSQAVLCAYTDARLTGCTKVNRHAIRLLVVNRSKYSFSRIHILSSHVRQVLPERFLSFHHFDCISQNPNLE